ncbi:hypothetical protein JTB14_035908 [Gonioctena quinquepunctata]|nr:hypothetical protein JTB14_035908 [Gonioctena quinquepunctata]
MFLGWRFESLSPRGLSLRLSSLGFGTLDGGFDVPLSGALIAIPVQSPSVWPTDPLFRASGEPGLGCSGFSKLEPIVTGIADPKEEPARVGGGVDPVVEPIRMGWEGVLEDPEEKPSSDVGELVGLTGVWGLGWGC